MRGCRKEVKNCSSDCLLASIRTRLSASSAIIAFEVLASSYCALANRKIKRSIGNERSVCKEVTTIELSRPKWKSATAIVVKIAVAGRVARTRKNRCTYDRKKNGEARLPVAPIKSKKAKVRSVISSVACSGTMCQSFALLIRLLMKKTAIVRAKICSEYGLSRSMLNQRYASVIAANSASVCFQLGILPL